VACSGDSHPKVALAQPQSLRSAHDGVGKSSISSDAAPSICSVVNAALVPVERGARGTGGVAAGVPEDPDAVADVTAFGAHRKVARREGER
jgi:hypothetical protein